jgi:hypothetical protein
MIRIGKPTKNLLSFLFLDHFSRKPEGYFSWVMLRRITPPVSSARIRNIPGTSQHAAGNQAAARCLFAGQWLSRAENGHLLHIFWPYGRLPSF